MHAALESVGESSLPAPAGVNLRFHHQIARSPSSRAICSASSAVRGDLSARSRGAKFLQQLFRLIFVNVHVGRRADVT